MLLRLDSLFCRPNVNIWLNLLTQLNKKCSTLESIMSELIPQKCGDALTNILWPLDTLQHCPDDLSINNHIRGFPGVSLQRISDISTGACACPSFGQENCRMHPLSFPSPSSLHPSQSFLSRTRCQIQLQWCSGKLSLCWLWSQTEAGC